MNLKFFDLNDKEQIFDEMAQFFILCKRNSAKFEEFGFEEEKTEDLNDIFQKYNDFLQKSRLADLGDIERFVKKYTKNEKIEVISDRFEMGSIHFFESYLQKEIHSQLDKEVVEEKIKDEFAKSFFVEAFDEFDEVQKILKMVRALIDEGVKKENIKIFASDVEYYYEIIDTLAPEYGLAFRSTLGEPILKYDRDNQYILYEAKRYAKRLQSIIQENFTQNIKDSLARSMRVYRSQGIEVTETNQIFLYKEIQHLFFIGADLEKFPPSRKKGIFYSKNTEELFYLNSLYHASLEIYDRMQKVAKNLTIIYQKNEHSGKDISPIIQKQPPKPIEYAWHICDEAKNRNKESIKFQPKRLSASQINTYINCPRAYYYKYVLKIESPAFEDTEMDAMLKGKIMHKVFELIVKDLMDTKVAYEKIDISKYITNALADDEIKDGLRGDISEKIFLQELLEIVKNFLIYLQEQNVKNALAEQKICLDENLQPIGGEDCDGFIVGYIDRIDINDHITIVDYKSSRKDKIDTDKLKEIKELKDVQLSLYILWAKQKYKKEVEASLLTFRTSDPETPYLAFATMKTCSESSKEYVCFDDAFENKLKTLIGSVRASIENGFFEIPQDVNCDYCAYMKICQKEK